ncbi:MAG: DUF523 domain-containing protein, partial [Candidatus Cloacimonetes bacterium]|nr:DUF523 domain-containing protein [Candidatus Cloacimonadota bacterium]
MLVKPRLIVSKCLEFDHCRYNGQILNSPFIRKLKPYVQFVPICPEVEIELSVPREPIRIVSTISGKRLINNTTGVDLTKVMHRFCRKFLEKITGVDGFILSSRSPSCGIGDVKIYPGIGDVPPFPVKTSGFFAQAIQESFPG